MPADAPAFEPLTVDGRPAPGSAFEHVLHALLDDLFAALPTWASQVGHHRLDDRWPDLSEAGRLARLALYARHRAALDALDEAGLSRDELIDRGIVLEALDGLRFEAEVLRETAWDPLGYVALLGDGLHGLLAREYAPWRHRGTAFVWRARRLPAVLDAARANLTGLPGRPVSRLHTETAIAQLPSLTDLVEEALAEADRQEGPGAGDIRESLQATAPAVGAAVDGFREFLEREVAPLAAGEGRLGPELFSAKLRHALSSDLPYEELRARALRDFALVRAEIVRLARGAWPAWFAGEPLPADDGALVRGVWGAIAGRHPAADELLESCRRETAAIEAFVGERGLLTLPEDPLRIGWTPRFLRPYGGAFLSPPGPLDRGQPSEFWVTPPDAAWPPARLESYLREQNERMLRLLCIHEAIPGHYLQMSRSNACPSLARAVFQSGLFAEGWAVYVTQVMMDAGFGADDPALLVCHWKYYLRAIVNVLLDIGIHVDGMGEEEALRLMIDGAFQEEEEARAKYLRARLSSTQLCTYYAGALEMWDLERAARRRAAAAGGVVWDEVTSERPVVAGLPAATDFDRRAHLEAVLAHGTPPIRWVRRLVLGDEPEPAGPR